MTRSKSFCTNKNIYKLAKANKLSGRFFQNIKKDAEKFAKKGTRFDKSAAAQYMYQTCGVGQPQYNVTAVYFILPRDLTKKEYTAIKKAHEHMRRRIQSWLISAWPRSK